MNANEPANPPRFELARKCAVLIRRAFGRNLPKIALVLGSGLQEVISAMEIHAELPFSKLPGFPTLSVNGHPGMLLLAKVAGMDHLVLSGRAHYYEGHSMEAVMYPIAVMAECGVAEVILTNAAGGINETYRPGDFMLISDHLNMVGLNPLRGMPPEGGKCFVDLSETYCPRLLAELKAAARRERIGLREGVYLGVSGPSYERPAEIRAFRMLGADAVGMSTIPEVLMARYRGMRVAAISCITNFAAGMRKGKLSHRDVLQKGRENARTAARLLTAFAKARAASQKI